MARTARAHTQPNRVTKHKAPFRLHTIIKYKNQDTVRVPQRKKSEQYGITLTSEPKPAAVPLNPSEHTSGVIRHQDTHTVAKQPSQGAITPSRISCSRGSTGNNISNLCKELHIYRTHQFVTILYPVSLCPIHN